MENTRKKSLVDECTKILIDAKVDEILDPNDPDLLRMEEIMEELKKLEKEN
jgi:hypothetical protein